MRRKQTDSEFKFKPKCNNNYDWSWKYSILLASVKNIGSPECPCKQGIQTVDQLLFQFKRLKSEKRKSEENCT